MPNRSHRNAGHIGMNRLRKQGLAHSSARAANAPTIAVTSHVIAVGDCLATLRKIPDRSIQLVI
jgi:site-specific DNA-methyltransferase (adenine-specific)